MGSPAALGNKTISDKGDLVDGRGYISKIGADVIKWIWVAPSLDIVDSIATETEIATLKAEVRWRPFSR
jgi:hypothetical protein